MQGINNRIQNNTALLVTHQLAPLQSVDNILVLRDGTLVEQGNFNELSQSGGLFEEMLNANLAQQDNKGNLDA